MKRLLSAAVAVSVLSFAGAALAADLSPPPKVGYPVKGAPYVAPLYDWTGFYVGAHAGVGWFQGAADNIAGTGTANSLSGMGYLGGGQIGYNYQLGSWVFGIELDMAYTDIRGKGTNPTLAPLEQIVRINWFGSAAGRFGVAWDRTLVYARAGVAYGEVKSQAHIPLVLLAEGKDTRVGWTVGVGAEWAFLHNWTVRAEYDYLDLGTKTVTLTSTTGATTTQDSKATAHMIKLGANYRFGWR